MDYRNLLGTAAIILSCAVLIQSLNSANAYPQGPNISLGSNPIDSANTTCSNSYTNLFTNNTSNTFVITEIILGSGNAAELKIDNQTIFYANSFSGRTSFYPLNTGFIVLPGSSVTCAHSGDHMTISGYYTH